MSLILDWKKGVLIFAVILVLVSTQLLANTVTVVSNPSINNALQIIIVIMLLSAIVIFLYFLLARHFRMLEVFLIHKDSRLIAHAATETQLKEDMDIQLFGAM
ncbi:MAG: hypothetical protein Q7J68_05640, partial [Thermoplasmata archaeon]|nr:hypothetical protein [Thermoplasmata archaeon]